MTMMRQVLNTTALITGMLMAAIALPTTAQAQHQPLIKPGLCAQGYVPVCAVKKKVLVTYVNSCAAFGVKARVIAADRGCFEGCPARYEPVCGTDRASQRREYGNACEAEKSGATDIRRGRCRMALRRITSPSVGVGPVP